MAEGDLITEDFQQEYRGLLLGAYTDFELQEMSGLASLAPVRSGSMDRFGNHGGVGGRHYTGIRYIIAKWDILGTDGNDAFRAHRDELASAFAPIEDPGESEPFVFKSSGRDKMRVYCRPIDREVPTDLDFARNYGMCAVRLEATDPFIYSNDQHSQVMNPGSSSGGLTFPLSFPLSFGTTTPGSSSVDNEGTAPAPWVATVVGEVIGLKITHVESGKFIELSDFTVETGNTLIIDSRARTILLNGTASRRGYLSITSRWFALDPGSNTIQFSVSAPSAGSMTFFWRDTYWSD